MKVFLKSNIWVVVLGMCLLTFLGHKAMETGNCIEASPTSIKVGVCAKNNSDNNSSFPSAPGGLGASSPQD